MTAKENIPRHLIDLHIHGHHGPDSQERAENILTAGEKLNLVGLAITDHDSAREYPELDGYQFPLILLPGAEVTTLEDAKLAHILLITPYREQLIDFLAQFSRPQLAQPGQVIAWVIEHYPSVAIVAHPFPRGGRAGASFAQIETWIKYFGTQALALEVANGGVIKFSLNKDGSPTQRAQKDWNLFENLVWFAQKHNLAQLGNSDAHKAKLVGRSATNLAESASTVEDIIELILQGACEPYLPNLDKLRG